MVDVQSGWPYCMQLPDKSSATAQSKYVLHNIDLYLRNLGHQKVVLQHDAENAIRGLAQAIQNHLGASKVSVREAPPYSHQSQGAVESMNAFVQPQIRALSSVARHQREISRVGYHEQCGSLAHPPCWMAHSQIPHKIS